MRAPLLILSLLLGFTPSASFAQSADERAVARSTAEQGVRAFQDGKYEAAVELLSRAESVVHAPTHLLYLARSLEHLGRLADAHETYTRLIAERLADNAPDAFLRAQQAAKAEAAALLPRIPEVTINVKGAPRESLTLSINEKEVANIGVGVPLRTNPGPTVVTVSAPGMKDAKAQLTLKEGQNETLVLVLEADPDAGQVAEQSEPEDPEQAQTSKETYRPVTTGSYVGLAMTGVFAATGTAFTIVAFNNDAKYRKLNDGQNESEAQSARKATQVTGAIADASFGAAIVAGAVTSILFLTRPTKERPPEGTSMTLAPRIGRNGAGLQIEGTF